MFRLYLLRMSSEPAASPLPLPSSWAIVAMTIIIMAKITVAKLETILTLIFTPPAADHHCACTQLELIFIEPAALQTKTRGDF